MHPIDPIRANLTVGLRLPYRNLEMANTHRTVTAVAEQRLKELGIRLPAPTEPSGTYVEAVQKGNVLF